VSFSQMNAEGLALGDNSFKAKRENKRSGIMVQ